MVSQVFQAMLLMKQFALRPVPFHLLSSKIKECRGRVTLDQHLVFTEIPTQQRRILICVLGNATGKRYSTGVVLSKCFIKQLSLKKTNVETSPSETIYLYGSESYLTQDQKYLKAISREEESKSSKQIENNNKQQVNLGVLEEHLIFKEKEL